MTRNIMIDLETWGKMPGCAIRSIGACEFSLENGLVASPFYVNVSLASQEHYGLRVEAETEEWWSKQETAAVLALDADQIHVAAAIDRLWNYVDRRGQDVQVWCHGLSFDLPILKVAAYMCDLPDPPWHFRNERDTRTIFGQLTLEQYEGLSDFNGTKHHAMHDAMNQASWVVQAMKHLTRPNIQEGGGK